jgi:hypothetical protein
MSSRLEKHPSEYLIVEILRYEKLRFYEFNVFFSHPSEIC